MKPSQRFEVLDGLRGVAAICVMLYHISLQTEFFIGPNANLAVDIFFMLSGFVLAHSYGAKIGVSLGDGDYLRRRLIRLYPMFAAGIILGLPILYLTTRWGLEIHTGQPIVGGSFALASVLNAIGLPYIEYGSAAQNSGIADVPIFPLDNPLWSLFFEAIASVAFLWLARLKSWRLACFTFAGWVCLMAIGIAVTSILHSHSLILEMGWDNKTFIGGFARVLYGFSFGMLLHRMIGSEKFRPVAMLVAKTPLSSYVSYAICAAILLFPLSGKGLYGLAVITVASPMLIIFGAFSTASGRFNLEIAKVLGWISFPLYCVHFPIMRLMRVVFIRWLDRPLDGFYIAVVTVVSIAIAALLTRYYDEPIRLRLSGKRQVQPAL